MLFRDRITPAPVPSAVKPFAHTNGAAPMDASPVPDVFRNFSGGNWCRTTTALTFANASGGRLVSTHRNSQSALRTKPRPKQVLLRFVFFGSVLFCTTTVSLGRSGNDSVLSLGGSGNDTDPVCSTNDNPTTDPTSAACAFSLLAFSAKSLLESPLPDCLPIRTALLPLLVLLTRTRMSPTTRTSFTLTRHGLMLAKASARNSQTGAPVGVFANSRLFD
mmetsp:Transcript_13219/g.43804  ORF Transcript_13219/g.43804 Transcript_13219/m.43804 type:complete len:219 (-) Transcript_13219:806-1462(-)